MVRPVLARKSWRLEEVLIPATAIGLLTAVGLLSLFAHKTESPPSGMGMLWASVVVFQFPLLLLVHRFLHRHGENWVHGFGFDLPTRPALWLWVVGGVAGCVTSLLAVNWGMQWLMQYLGWPAGLQSAVEALQNGTWGVRASIAFTAVGLAPLVEEPLFRGILYQTCRDAGYRRSGLWFTSLVFGLVHGHLPSLLPLTLFGAYQCWLYERTGNLLACILTHAGFNAVFVVLTLTGTASG